jgi:Tfp pilus assembly ATPase PilU
VNLHKSIGRLGAVLRRIRTKIPALETLGKVDWAKVPRGQGAGGHAGL